MARSPRDKRSSGASKDTAQAPELNAVEEEALAPEFTPGESDGDMFGGTPSKKAEQFWPSAKRLVGLLAPRRSR